MRIFIAPDTHGKAELLEALYHKAAPSSIDTTVHIGDIANCVVGSQEGDVASLEFAYEHFNYVLVGNHEHPYFGGPAFSGFHAFPEVKEALTLLDKAKKIKPCHVVGNTLISHAGLVDFFVDDEVWEIPATAQTMHDHLCAAWERNPTAPVFKAISFVRGGSDNSGGLFWSDWMERKSHAFNQVVGHTPQRDGKVDLRTYGNGNWSLNIDAGAKWSQDNAIGVWLDSQGQILEYVEVAL